LNHKAKSYQSGCGLQAGCTCRICIRRGCRAAETRADNASREALERRNADEMTNVQFEGGISRLGRRTARMSAPQFVGPSAGLGRAAPTRTTEAEPSGCSTRETPTCGVRWRRTQSAWRGNVDRRSTAEGSFPQLIVLMLYGGGLLIESAREALGGMETLLRLRPKRVGCRRWSARLGEMNSINKCTLRGSAWELAMPHLA
jgi:hypothetical protein